MKDADPDFTHIHSLILPFRFIHVLKIDPYSGILEHEDGSGR